MKISIASSSLEDFSSSIRLLLQVIQVDIVDEDFNQLPFLFCGLHNL